MDIERLRRLLTRGTVTLRFSDHAFIEARKDGLSTAHLRAASERGRVIEDYGERALLLHFAPEDRLPYHVVLEYAVGDAQATVVTAYAPEAEKWERDWKTRRRRRRRK